jgi:hypothetical protein
MATGAQACAFLLPLLHGLRLATSRFLEDPEQLKVDILHLLSHVPSQERFAPEVRRSGRFACWRNSSATR